LLALLSYLNHFIMAFAPTTLAPFLSEHYAKIFGRSWAVIPSALVVAALNVFLFAFDKPWTASDGMRNWGDWLFQSLRVVNPSDMLPPWLYSGSVLNLGLLLGGLSAALLSREFGYRPAPASELVKGALDGLLMGWGAMLSFGCNIGGFFSALSRAVCKWGRNDGGTVPWSAAQHSLRDLGKHQAHTHGANAIYVRL
jgi:uncharacterized protein